MGSVVILRFCTVFFSVFLVMQPLSAMADSLADYGAPESIELQDPAYLLRDTPYFLSLISVKKFWVNQVPEGLKATVVHFDGSRSYGIGKTQREALISALGRRRPDPQYKQNPLLRT